MPQQTSHLLQEITLSNFLSYGPKSEPISLNNLNVLVGPNGSGKSNLIETIAILRSAPGDLRGVIRKGGGVGEWIWKGNSQGIASIKALIHNPQSSQKLCHTLAFGAQNQAFYLDDERIENPLPELGKEEAQIYYHYRQGNPYIISKKEELRITGTVEKDQSILSQRRDPDNYPEISYLSNTYNKIRVYREWAFGRNTVFREPQKADMRNDRLEEDFSNLGLFLNRLRRNPKAKKAIISALEDLYEGLQDFDVSIEGGTVQVFFTEGDFTIPATRLSDGTLRYLCLLAILFDPEPPPLICIEEPELGLHPDMLPKIADHLKEASERTQLIVTTHSDILVDAFTEQPESVLVCEKHDGQTIMRRLDQQNLTAWLEKYRLGELWMRGHLGGMRW